MICPGGLAASSAARSHGRDATAIGVDPDLVVRRLEEEHPSEDAAPASMPAPSTPAPSSGPTPVTAGAQASVATAHTQRRVLAVAAILDLLVAGAIGFGFAAAGSRLLWPVLAIAAYHAVGLIFTGRSPMLALLLDQGQSPALRGGPLRTAGGRPSARPDRAPATAAARTATARLRQPSRRASRGSRGRAPN